MNKYYKILLLTVVSLSGLQAQFLDAVREISFDGPGQRVKTTSGYQLSGSAFKIGYDSSIEGAAIRLSGDQQAIVWFQFMEGDGQWSKKYKAKTFVEPNSDRFIASILDESIEFATAIRYEVHSLKTVTFLTGGVFDRRDGETKMSNNPPSIKPKRSGVEKPKVISREEWGARSPESGYSNHPYFRKLTLHHAAGWAAKTLDEGKAAVKSIQEFHQDGRGWSDIGYHFLVDMGGNIYQGRPETVLGAHVGGANTGNIGVCVLGCYHPPETSLPCYDEMTYATEKSLIHLYSWIADTYGVDPNVLKGHRDYFGTTSCPGDNVWPLLPQMRADIVLFIQFGEQPTRYALFQNYPNPFNTTTTLHYDVPEISQVTLTIYDILGREVITLVNEEQHYGYKRIDWDGRGKTGHLVAPGIYFYRAVMGPLTETKKMVLLK